MINRVLEYGKRQQPQGGRGGPASLVGTTAIQPPHTYTYTGQYGSRGKDSQGKRTPVVRRKDRNKRGVKGLNNIVKRI